MSGSTSRSLLAALKAAGAASILSWAVVLSVGPALADRLTEHPGPRGVAYARLRGVCRTLRPLPSSVTALIVAAATDTAAD